MIHLVSEPDDSPVKSMEYEPYEPFGPERIAQMEQEDMDRELFNENMLQFRDETKSAMAELKSQLSAVISILQDLNNEEAATPISPTPAANEMDELAGQFPFNIHGNYIHCDLVEDEYGDIVEPSSQNLFDEMSGSLPIELKEENDCHGLGKMDDQNNACKVFAELPESNLTENLLDIEVAKATHYLLDKRPTLSPVNSDEGLYGNNDPLSPYPYIIETGSSDHESSWVNSQNLSYEDVVVLRVSSFNAPLVSKQGFNPQVFDPGTQAHFKQEDYMSRLNANDSSLHCTNSVIYQVVSSNQNDADLHHDLDYFSESETTAVSLDDGVLVENTISSSEELLIFEDYVCRKSTIKDSLIDEVRKINGTLVSERIMRCEITFKSSLSEVREQNGKNDNNMVGMFLIVYPSPMLNSVNFINALHKTWVKEVTLRMNVNLHPIVMRNDALRLYDETTPAFRTNVIDGQRMEPYTRGTNSNTLFDPGGGGKCLLNGVRGIVFTLDTEALDAFFDGLKGVAGLLMFIFDPGNGSLHLTGCASLNSSEMPGSFVVALWLSKVSSYFNPNGCCLFNNYCDHSLNRDVPVQVFIGENVMFVVKMISCCILIYDGWIYSLGLAISSGTWPSFLSPLKADFAWDPGICAISVHILEDKDVFKRVGNRILVMVMIRTIRDGQIKIHVISMFGFYPGTGANEDLLSPNAVISAVISETSIDGLLIFTVDLWIATKLFCFDPGGCHWPQVGCQFFEFNGASIHYNEYKTILKQLMAVSMLFLDGIRIFRYIMDVYIVVTFGHLVYIATAAHVYYELGNHLSFKDGFNGVLSAEVPVYYELIKLLHARDLCVQMAAFRSLYFQLGNVFVTTLIKVMLRIFTWLHVWKCHWDGRKTWILSICTEMENFIWNPGIVGFLCYCVILPKSCYHVLYDFGVPNEYMKNNVAAILPNMSFHRSYLRLESPVSSPLIKSGQPPYDNIVHLQDMGWRLVVPICAVKKSRTIVDIMKDLKFNEGSTGELLTKHRNGIGTHIEMMGHGKHIDGVNKFIECLLVGSWLYVCEVVLDTISMILVYALEPFADGHMTGSLPPSSAMLKLFVWIPGTDSHPTLRTRCLLGEGDVTNAVYFIFIYLSLYYL